MNALKEDFLEIQIGTSADSLAKSLDSQRELFHSQVDQLQRIVVTQCKLTGANPLSQEMAAGALSIQIVIVDALLQRFLPLARRRIETAQAQILLSTFLSLNAIGTSTDSLAKSLDSQRELFHSQVDQLQRIVVTQCKLTGANPLSQEMATGALSIQIVIVDALLQRFLPLARRRIETAQAQI